MNFFYFQNWSLHIVNRRGSALASRAWFNGGTVSQTSWSRTMANRSSRSGLLRLWKAWRRWKRWLLPRLQSLGSSRVFWRDTQASTKSCSLKTVWQKSRSWPVTSQTAPLILLRFANPWMDGSQTVSGSTNSQVPRRFSSWWMPLIKLQKRCTGGLWQVRWVHRWKFWTRSAWMRDFLL